MNPAEDPVYQNSVKPFMWICAAILPSAYVIGLLFSLHTHADMVWKNPTSTSTKHPIVEARTATVVHPQGVYPVHIISEEQDHPNEQTPINSYKIQSMLM